MLQQLTTFHKASDLFWSFGMMRTAEKGHEIWHVECEEPV
jgi:hypothetical protein